MIPYYDDGNGIQIYHGDCREILPTLEPVDLVLTDPPYNVQLKYVGFVDAMWIDAYRRFSREWWVLAMTLGAGRVVLTPGPSNLSFWACLEPAWIYCWRTSSNTPGGRAARRLGWEPLVAFAFPLKPFATDVLDYAISAQRGTGGHPCPNPFGLFKVVIDRWSTGTILDPFMGIGTTLVAAKELHRKAIGCEIEEKYCEIAANRLAQGVLPYGGVKA